MHARLALARHAVWNFMRFPCATAAGTCESVALTGHLPLLRRGVADWRMGGACTRNLSPVERCDMNSREGVAAGIAAEQSAATDPKPLSVIFA